MAKSSSSYNTGETPSTPPVDNSGSQAVLQSPEQQTHTPYIPKTDDLSSQTYKTPCEELKSQIEKTNKQLNDWQKNYDALLDYPNDDNVDKIIKLGGILDKLRNKLQQLKADQRRLGCLNPEAPQISYDNQTVISTSSVRRKGAEAKPGPQNTTSSTVNK